MAMTIFKDEFNTRFVVFFGILLVGKLAHGLLRDRLDFVSDLHANCPPGHISQFHHCFI